MAYMWDSAPWPRALLVGLAACGQVQNHGDPVDAAADTPASTCAPTPAGLAARWRGEMSMTDDLGRYAGAAVGNVAYTQGRHGSAFALNGTNALISISDNDALWPTGSFSVEGWVNASGGAATSRLITKYDCGGNCPGGTAATFPNWSLDITATGYANFTVRPASGLAATITDADPKRIVRDGAWHHLVGVRDIQAKQLVLYVDGEPAVSKTLSGHELDPMTNTDGEVDPVTIGASRTANSAAYIDYLHGAIDEVAYYSAAISANEVKAIYSAPDGECR